MCDKTKSTFIIALFLFFGLYVIASKVSSSYYDAHELDRSIAVTGFSERTVKADSVFWPISFVVKGNNLKQSALKMQEDAKIINEFLLANGISENEITVLQANVQYQTENNLMRKGMLQMQADSFSIENSFLSESNSLSDDLILTQSPEKETIPANTSVNKEDEKENADNTEDSEEEKKEDENKDIYIISNTIVIRSEKVDLVRELSYSINELLTKNINISNQYNYGQIEYNFNKLDPIKQEMLKEASKKAFELAKNFAIDSNSELGRVKKARQGDFNIQTPNRYEEYIKKIRVENQVEYYLVD